MLPTIRYTTATESLAIAYIYKTIDKANSRNFTGVSPARISYKSFSVLHLTPFNATWQVGGFSVQCAAIAQALVKTSVCDVTYETRASTLPLSRIRNFRILQGPAPRCIPPDP
jgi:hypothetical protein